MGICHHLGPYYRIPSTKLPSRIHSGSGREILSRRLQQGAVHRRFALPTEEKVERLRARSKRVIAHRQRSCVAHRATLLPVNRCLCCAGGLQRHAIAGTHGRNHAPALSAYSSCFSFAASGNVAGQDVRRSSFTVSRRCSAQRPCRSVEGPWRCHPRASRPTLSV